MTKKPKKAEGAGILDEVVKATGVKRKAGESAQDYARRLALAVDKLPEDDWAAMSEPAQLWVNDAVAAADADKVIDLPPGLADDEAEVAAADEPDAVDDVEDESEEVEEPAPKAGKKKPSNKKAAPVKAADKKVESKSAPKAGKKKPVGKKAVAGKPANKVAKPSPARKASGAASIKEPRTGTKRAKMIEMLSRTKGATVAEIAKEFDWEPHTTRASISMARKAGIKVDSEQDGKRGRVYKIAA